MGHVAWTQCVKKKWTLSVISCLVCDITVFIHQKYQRPWTSLTPMFDSKCKHLHKHPINNHNRVQPDAATYNYLPYTIHLWFVYIFQRAGQLCLYVTIFLQRTTSKSVRKVCRCVDSHNGTKIAPKSLHESPWRLDSGTSPSPRILSRSVSQSRWVCECGGWWPWFVKVSLLEALKLWSGVSAAQGLHIRKKIF